MRRRLGSGEPALPVLPAGDGRRFRTDIATGRLRRVAIRHDVRVQDDDAPRLLLSRDLDRLGNDARAARRASEAGELVRVRIGAFVSEEEWRDADRRERHLLLAQSVSATRSVRPVISHWSAIAAHDLPTITPWPADVHVTVDARGPSSTRGIRRHRTSRPPRTVEVRGLLVTALDRTLVDFAAAAPMLDSVAALDSALRSRRDGRPPLLAKHDLLDQWEQLRPFRGEARALAAIEFAVDGADSPLESASRVNMHALGFPSPVLQMPWFDHLGHIGDSDFGWPEFHRLGEADGDSKYLDPRLRRGRSIEQVILDEKRREDRMRSSSRMAVTRWDWRTGTDAERLRRHLLSAGLPVLRPRRYAERRAASG